MTNVQDAIDDLLNELIENPDSDTIEDLNLDQVEALRKKINPYGTVAGTITDKYMCYSYYNLSQEFMKKQTVTSVVGFLYRMASEYFDGFYSGFKTTTDKKDVKPVVVEEDGKYRVENIPPEQKEEIIKEFLDAHFEYNPDAHVKSSKTNNKKDGVVIDEEREKLLMMTPPDKLRDVYEHVPPSDYFHRLTYYSEANYNELRTATECIYGDKPDLEEAIIFHAYFDTEDECERFKVKHESEFNSSIRVAEFGKWVLQGPWSENRERINFYNRNTALLKAIVDANAEGEKFGKEVMENRVRIMKRKNVEEEGPHDPGLKKYTDQYGKSIELDQDGCPTNAIEVKVHTLSQGGKKMDTKTIYTEAQEPTLPNK